MRVRTQARVSPPDPTVDLKRAIERLSLSEASTPLAQRAEALEDIRRIAFELSHDLRQPLTSLNMNLQTAFRLLQQPNPKIDAALEALTDCLGTERDVTRILEQAQHRFEGLVPTDAPMSLTVTRTVGEFLPSAEGSHGD